MSTPLFAIITPTYNAAGTLERTLKSVDEQTFTDYEHIIVDGASTDKTTAISLAHPNPRRHFQSEPDKGLYDAMNKGIAATTGQYLIFLNAGDKFHSTDTLERLAQLAAKIPKPDILYGQTSIVDNNGLNPRPRHLIAPAELNAQSFATGMVVCHQAFVASRAIVGKYDLRYRLSADYEWCIRCLQQSKGNAYAGDKPLIDYLDEGLTTRNHRASLRERFSIMCSYYGYWPTLFRHFGFAMRAFKRKISK